MTSNLLEAGIYDALAANAALASLPGSDKFFRGIAPQGVSYPVIVYKHAGGGDENVTSKDGIDVDYLVMAISEVSTGEAEIISDNIHAALHKQTVSVAGLTNIWTRCKTFYEADLPDEQTGIVRFSRGRFVRIRLVN